MVGPGNEMTGAAGRGGLAASHVGREQVIDALKTAYVDGRLDKDEFDLRVSKALATYAELDALTADIPARPAAASLAEPARQSHNKKVIQRGTAAGAGASMAFTAALVTAAGAGPVVGMIVVPLIGAVMAVLLAGLMTLLSWALERGSARQSAPGAPPGTDGTASGRAAAADPSRSMAHGRSQRGGVRSASWRLSPSRAQTTSMLHRCCLEHAGVWREGEWGW